MQLARVGRKFANHKEMEPHIGNQQKDARKGQGVSVFAERNRAEAACNDHRHQECRQAGNRLAAEDRCAVNDDPPWIPLRKHAHDSP